MGSLFFWRRRVLNGESAGEAGRVTGQGLQEVDDVSPDQFGCPTSSMYRHHDPDFGKENAKARKRIKRFAKKVYGVTLDHVS
jgi:hypothetical protein